MSRIISTYRSFSQRTQVLRIKLVNLLRKFPVLSFVLVLGLLLGVIALGSYLRQPATESAVEAPEPKVTQLYELGEAPQIMVQAQVEKAGIIKIVALSPGIVQKINVTEGSQVKRGTRLFSFSNNYQGGNLASLGRQLSQKSYQSTLDTYQLQKDSLSISRELAIKAADQSSDLREINRKSIDETKSLISLNEDILSSVNTQITKLEQTNVGGANDQAIAELKASRAQIRGGLNGLQAGLRTTEYVNDENQETAQLARLGKDQALKQLELQEKALDLGKDIALLNLRISQVSESLMFPSAPCAGVVERVYVQVGQSVNPGTVLATIKGDDLTAEAVALVTAEIAQTASQFQPSLIQVGEEKLELMPRYIAQEPTDGNLHAVIFDLPDAVAQGVTNDSYLSITLPLAAQNVSDQQHFIPLDSIYQSQDGASVLVAVDDNGQLKAQSKKLELGQVYGNFVKVTSGLNKGDQVIVSRAVLEGDVVTSL